MATLAGLTRPCSVFLLSTISRACPFCSFLSNRVSDTDRIPQGIETRQLFNALRCTALCSYCREFHAAKRAFVQRDYCLGHQSNNEGLISYCELSHLVHRKPAEICIVFGRLGLSSAFFLLLQAVKMRRHLLRHRPLSFRTSLISCLHSPALVAHECSSYSLFVVDYPHRSSQYFRAIHLICLKSCPES